MNHSSPKAASRQTPLEICITTVQRTVRVVAAAARTALSSLRDAVDFEISDHGWARCLGCHEFFPLVQWQDERSVCPVCRKGGVIAFRRQDAA